MNIIIYPKIRIIVTKSLLDNPEFAKKQPVLFDSFGFPSALADFRIYGGLLYGIAPVKQL